MGDRCKQGAAEAFGALSEIGSAGEECLPTDGRHRGSQAGPMVVREPERKTEMENFKEFDEVVGPAGGYGAGAHGVFQREIPPDDPGDEFAEGGVGVGIGGPGERNHGGEFGVAETREGAAETGENKGQHERGTRRVSTQAREDEDAGADNGTDAECGEGDRTESSFEGIASLLL